MTLIGYPFMADHTSSDYGETHPDIHLRSCLHHRRLHTLAFSFENLFSLRAVHDCVRSIRQREEVSYSILIKFSFILPVM